MHAVVHSVVVYDSILDIFQVLLGGTFVSGLRTIVTGVSGLDRRHAVFLLSPTVSLLSTRSSDRSRGRAVPD